MSYRGSEVYIIVTLGEMPREQVFFHLPQDSCSWTLMQIDFEEHQVTQNSLATAKENQAVENTLNA